MKLFYKIFLEYGGGIPCVFRLEFTVVYFCAFYGIFVKIYFIEAFSENLFLLQNISCKNDKHSPALETK